jgi:hypothetical protein
LVTRVYLASQQSFKYPTIIFNVRSNSLAWKKIFCCGDGRAVANFRNSFQISYIVFCDVMGTNALWVCPVLFCPRVEYESDIAPTAKLHVNHKFHLQR